MADKILSIIVPSYNMEACLSKCLESLIIDDKELFQELDVIVVNDGSKDRTSKIAHKFEMEYPGVFRIIDKSNGNYGSCINAALQEAKGAFVRILDADDTYDKDGLCYLVRYINDDECSCADIDLFVTPYVRVGSNGESLGKIDYGMLSESITYTPNDLSLISASIAMHAITYRTKCLREIGYRQTEGISYTDTEWCFMPIVAVCKWRYLPRSVYRYCIGREGQTVSKDSSIKNFWMYRTLLGRMMEWYLDGKFNDVYRPFLKERLYVLTNLMYHMLISWLPIKSALYEFDEIDKIVQRDCVLSDRLGAASLSRFMKWQYVAYLRKHTFMRRFYLYMLRAYLFCKDMICTRYH